MAFVFTTLSDVAFDQVYSFTRANILKDNQKNMFDSLSVEHNFSDGIHTILRQATGNDGSPAANGGGILFISKKVAAPSFVSVTDTFTAAQLDNSMDWRDRKLAFIGWSVGAVDSTEADKVLLGGSLDSAIWGGVRQNLQNDTYETTPQSAGTTYIGRSQGDISSMNTGWGGTAEYSVLTNAFCYTEAGHSESTFPTASTGANILLDRLLSGSEVVSATLFASSSDGDLILLFSRDGGADTFSGSYYVVHGILIYGSDEGII